MKSRLLSVCLVACLLLAGCGSHKATDDDVPTAHLLPTTTTAPDPYGYGAPETIDAAYINKILNLIEDKRGEMRRDVLATHQFSTSDQAIVKAIYSGDALSFQFRLWTDQALLDHPDFTPNPPAAIATVKTIHHADSSCIWVTASLNEDASAIHPTGPADIDYVLKSDSKHDKAINPTPWTASEATMPNTLKAEQACG